ncbi:hypothetical protein TSA6c_02820 [Azospirillum sp. TSA6c]|nr:hypothetical protein TSA6c_09975 [Azospirillum sp. TSA6c]PWC53191.1 hypothetical protein TSA6c_02820 [Azospirillum sp. TSA6c]
MLNRNPDRHDKEEEEERDAYRPRQLELLDQLERLFFSRGYRALTMDLIAQELRCSKRALYEIAPNRKMLFLKVVARWASRVQALGDSAASQFDHPRKKLTAYLEPGITESRGMTDRFLEDIREDDQAREVLENHQRVRMARLQEIIEYGIGNGEFADVHAKLVAGICLAAIERINDPHFLADAGLGFSDAFSELYRLLLDGLARG